MSIIEFLNYHLALALPSPPPFKDYESMALGSAAVIHNVDKIVTSFI